ncbi:MAG: MEDS domain-containing protein [Chloroflexi bacterium]|nr:MEDS domain-containing protein [Chloroflexota bacterium]
MTMFAPMTEGMSVPPSGRSEFGHGEHVVQFYETDAFLVDSLREFIGAGLRAGDAGVVIATGAHREGLEAGLRADGLDVPAAATSGQYVALDATDLLPAILRDGSPDPTRFHEILGDVVRRAAEGRRQVRIYGELVALLWAEGNYGAAIQLEDLWNELHRTHSFTLLCGYPMQGFGGETLADLLRDVCAEHARVIPAESYSALASPDERLRAVALLQQQATSLEAEIAERKTAEAQLHRSLRLRDEFLSTISHDLKTPLAVLQGQAQVLQRRAARGELDEQATLQGLERIVARSRGMTEMIDALLDVAQLRTGEH